MRREHIRLLLAFESMLHLSGALVGRVPAPPSVIFGIGLTVSLLMFAIPAIHDKVSKRCIHPASVWVPILFVVWSVFLNTLVFPSAVGFKVASWLVR